MTHPKMTTTASFDIQRLQFLDEHNQLVQPLPAFADATTLLQLYRAMALIRAFDNKTINLQRTGRIGTFPASRGQEAIGVAMGHALQPNDIFCPYYRDQGAFLLRGGKLADILAYWGGDERGSDYTSPVMAEDFPLCVPIAGQLLHAAGVAYAVKYRQQQRAVLTVCGDGGTSKGDFYEALNIAGSWQLPLVFVINNNQWAISVPRNKQSACITLAQKAIAGGFSGTQVDGNDVIATRYAIATALDKARHGSGPTLIEALTYRLCDHTTADDASRYTRTEDLKSAWQAEPIARLGHYLESQGLWSRPQEADLQKELALAVNSIVAEYLSMPAPKPTDMFDYLYAKLPSTLYSQRAEVERRAHE